MYVAAGLAGRAPAQVGPDRSAAPTLEFCRSRSTHGDAPPRKSAARAGVSETRASAGVEAQLRRASRLFGNPVLRRRAAWTHDRAGAALVHPSLARADPSSVDRVSAAETVGAAFRFQGDPFDPFGPPLRPDRAGSSFNNPFTGGSFAPAVVPEAAGGIWGAPDPSGPYDSPQVFSASEERKRPFQPFQPFLQKRTRRGPRAQRLPPPPPPPEDDGQNAIGRRRSVFDDDEEEDGGTPPLAGPARRPSFDVQLSLGLGTFPSSGSDRERPAAAPQEQPPARKPAWDASRYAPSLPRLGRPAAAPPTARASPPRSPSPRRAAQRPPAASPPLSGSPPLSPIDWEADSGIHSALGIYVSKPAPWKPVRVSRPPSPDLAEAAQEAPPAPPPVRPAAAAAPARAGGIRLAPPKRRMTRRAERAVPAPEERVEQAAAEEEEAEEEEVARVKEASAEPEPPAQREEEPPPAEAAAAASVAAAVEVEEEKEQEEKEEMEEEEKEEEADAAAETNAEAKETEVVAKAAPAPAPAPAQAPARRGRPAPAEEPSRAELERLARAYYLPVGLAASPVLLLAPRVPKWLLGLALTALGGPPLLVLLAAAHSVSLALRDHYTARSLSGSSAFSRGRDRAQALRRRMMQAIVSGNPSRGPARKLWRHSEGTLAGEVERAQAAEAASKAAGADGARRREEVAALERRLREAMLAEAAAARVAQAAAEAAAAAREAAAAAAAERAAAEEEAGRLRGGDPPRSSPIGGAGRRAAAAARAMKEAAEALTAAAAEEERAAKAEAAAADEEADAEEALRRAEAAAEARAKGEAAARDPAALAAAEAEAAEGAPGPNPPGAPLPQSAESAGATAEPSGAEEESGGSDDGSSGGGGAGGAVGLGGSGSPGPEEEEEEEEAEGKGRGLAGPSDPPGATAEETPGSSGAMQHAGVGAPLARFLAALARLFLAILPRPSAQQRAQEQLPVPASPAGPSTPSSSTPPTPANKPSGGKSLAGIAGIVALGTLISKLFGLVRQQAIAAAFGVGPAVNAFNYASVVPGFFFILLGGINGPFHSSMVSVLSKYPDPRVAGPLVDTISTMVGGVLSCVTLLLIGAAGPIVDMAAPGVAQAALAGSAEAILTRAIAVRQLRIMAPMAVLSGLIGVSFGTLSARDLYWLPSVSPLLSSATTAGAMALLMWRVGLKELGDPKNAILGGMVLAWSTLAGAVLQWLVQVWAQMAAGITGRRHQQEEGEGARAGGEVVKGDGFNLGRVGRLFRPRVDLSAPGVREVLSLLGPATLSSGMGQINVYMDLLFASFVPHGAAAALTYAHLLIQTPVGIASSMLLVPLMPLYSRLAGPNGDRKELKTRIRQGIFLSGLAMLPVAAVTFALALPVVRLVYERAAFDAAASAAVAAALQMFALGMFPGLARDVLVRVFYALGDGAVPFRNSVLSIALNGVLDFALIRPLGAPGLVLASSLANAVSLVVLLAILHRKLQNEFRDPSEPAEEAGLPLAEWAASGAALAAGTAAAAAAATAVSRFFMLAHLAAAGGSGVVAFAAVLVLFRVPEVATFVSLVRRKLPARFRGSAASAGGLSAESADPPRGDGEA
eukprot:tig00022080_g23789.t2